MYKTERVVSGCHNDIPQTEGLKHQKFFFHSSGGQSQRSAFWLIWFLVRALFLGDSGHLLVYPVLTDLPSTCVLIGTLVSLPSRDKTLIPLYQGHTFIMPRLTSSQQIQTHLDSGHQHMNGGVGWGNRHLVYNRDHAVIEKYSCHTSTQRLLKSSSHHLQPPEGEPWGNSGWRQNACH